MQKKLRHSKFRNTGILFELLTKQITADILSGNDTSTAKDLLFKYFKENTVLGSEWRLYNFLLNERVKDETHAERFLSVILEQRKKLNKCKLAEEKYNLIKEMRDLYPLNDFLKSSIKNYKIFASIYKLFEEYTSTNKKFDVSEIYQAKTCIVENISDKPKQSLTESEEDLYKLYQQQNEEIRLLSFKLLVDGIDKKYSNLDNDQKEILREFINNVSNTNSLGNFISKKVLELKSKLNEISSLIGDNNVIKIKINEVTHQLDKIKPKNGIIKDNQIMVLLLSHELLKEVKKHITTEEAPNENE